MIPWTQTTADGETLAFALRGELMTGRNRIPVGIVALFLISTSLQPMLWGQATGSAVSGSVRDSSQAVIAGATVTVTNTETGIVKTRQTDGSGRYRIGELPPGIYQVSIAMAGFSQETRKDVQL